MVRFYLDTIEVTNPIGWEGIKTTIKRESDTDGLLVYKDNELEFTGDGYDYLWSKAQTEGFCYRVAVSVTKQYEGLTKRILSGYIYISDVTFNEKLRTAKTKIEDNSFFGTINNNKNVKAVVTSGKSKNGVDITPCTAFALDVYDLTNNTVLRTCFAVRIDDAFRYLVAYMSDGEISFASDTFSFGGKWGEFVITDGSKLSGYNSTIYNSAPITAFSFKELYDELKKRFPIGFTLESPYTNPVLRIEDLDYFNSTTQSSVVMSDVDEIRTRFDQQKLYSSLSLGSTVVKDGTAFLDFPEDIDFFGFKQESYAVLGTCNIDNELNLVGDWVVSSNIIQDCTVENNQDNDDALFFIETVQSSEFIGRTRNTNYLNIPITDPADRVYYYNESLTNRSVAERYLGLIPNSIAQYFAPNGTGNFTAATSADVTNTGINPTWTIVADAVSVNVGLHYDGGTGIYTAYNGGVFDFEVNVFASVPANSPFDGYVRIMIYDSTGSLRLRGAALGANTGVRNVRYIMSEGDTAKLVYYSGNTTGVSVTSTVFASSYWKCTANTGTGGIFQDYDPADYAVNIHEFEYPVSEAQIDEMIDNPTHLIRFYSQAEFQRFGWISEVNINHFTGMATVKLINSKATNGN